MPGFNPDKINIHDLTVEEPERETEMVFISEDVTPADWEEIEKEREKIKKETDGFQKYVDMCAYEKLLGRKPDVSNGDWRKLSDKMSLLQMTAGWTRKSDSYEFKKIVSELAQYASAAQILGEEQQGKAEIISLIEKVRPRNYDFRDVATSTSSEESAVLASLEVVLGAKPDLIEAEWRVFEKIREVNLPIANYYTYVDMLRAETILGRKPEIPEAGWRKMRGILEHFRQTRNWYYFSKVAADIAILSADEVRIPEGGGLELIRYKKPELKSETPQMPEQRQF